MKYLKIFNEFNDPYDEYIDDLQQFCEMYLAYLLDKGFKVIIDDNKVHYKPIRINISSQNNFYWSEVKDYIIPFLQILSKKYELDSDEYGNPIELHEVVPQNGSTGSSIYSYLYSLNDIVNEIGDFLNDGYGDDVYEISYISLYLKQPKPLLEAKTSKQPLKDFCEMYLAYLLDDETYKLKIDYEKSHIISEVRATTNKWRNTGYVKTWDDAGNQFIDVRNSPRFDTIILSREIIKKVNTRNYNYDTGEYEPYSYNENKPTTFNWGEIKDHFIPFFTILDRRYRVVNITFTDGKNIKGVRKEDIEKDIPFAIKEIYITVRK